MPDAVTLLSSITVSTAASGFLLWLTKEWIADRLKSAIQHEYNQKLEAHKSKLASENAITIEQLKTATSSLIETKKIGHNRILQSIDELWQAILLIDQSTPSAVSLLDFLTDHEYPSIFEQQNQFHGQVAELNHQLVQTGLHVTREFEKQRPYIGEQLWALFFSYRAIKGRLAFLIMNDRDHGTRTLWRDDPGIRQHLEANLSTKHVNQIYDAGVAGLWTLTEMMKQYILRLSNQIISGERSANDSFRVATKFADTFDEPQG